MIERTGLLERITRPSEGHWSIVAGAGFGKTVLLEQVRAALIDPTIIVRRPIAGTDLMSFLAELADATRRYEHGDTSAAILGAEGDVASIAQAVAADSCAFATDDIHQWDDEVSEFLLSLSAAAYPTSTP